LRLNNGEWLSMYGLGACLKLHYFRKLV
jgi:hypothetical protein